MQLKTLVNPNLYVLCQDAQALILDGWKFSDGYPLQLGWQFTAQLEKKEIEVEAPRKLGRPTLGKNADK